jgi:hypothetical protein
MRFVLNQLIASNLVFTSKNIEKNKSECLKIQTQLTGAVKLIQKLVIFSNLK